MIKRILSSTAFGRSILSAANAAAARNTLGDYGIALSSNFVVDNGSGGETLQNSPLTLTVGPGTWRVQTEVNFRNGSGTPGCKVAIAATGATFLSGRRYFAVSNNAITSYAIDQDSGAGAMVFAAGDAAFGGFDVTFNVATSATFTVQVAQNSASADDTIAKIGSFLKVSRLAD